MTTALQIINRGAELIGYKDPDEALSGNDAANFLAILNDLVGTWNTQRLFVVATQTVSATVSASPVSIGPSQTLNTARPIRIEGAFVRSNGIDYPVKRWLTAAEYDAIPNKSEAGDFAEEAYYSPGLPYGSIYLRPVPSSAALHVRVMTQLSEFADLTTEYDLAPGYKRALELSLAEELQPGRAPFNPRIAQMAGNARRFIKVANFEPLVIEGSDAAGVTPFDIVTGQ